MSYINKYGSVKVIKKIKKFSISDGCDWIAKESNQQKDFYRCKDRIDCFLTKGFICVKCNLRASHFSLEEIESDSFSGITLNLYGEVKDVLMLFTKDHIIPKSKGGADDLSNYQTMCWSCNKNKGNNIE